MAVPLDFLRAVSEQFLPDTCSVQRATESSSGEGTTQTWSNHLTGVACRVSPLEASASEALGADASLQAVAQWTVWLPYGTDVTVKDRVIYGTRTFEVARVGARSYEAIRELICREVI